MLKGKKGRKLSRKKAQRQALLKGLISALVLNEKIKTTQAKAKEISSAFERFITLAKRKKGLTAQRYLLRLFSQRVTKKIINEIAPRYQNRPGGYTRVIKLGSRKSNGAKMAIIELIKF